MFLTHLFRCKMTTTATQSYCGDICLLIFHLILDIHRMFLLPLKLTIFFAAAVAALWHVQYICSIKKEVVDCDLLFGRLATLHSYKKRDTHY